MPRKKIIEQETPDIPAGETTMLPESEPAPRDAVGEDATAAESPPVEEAPDTPDPEPSPEVAESTAEGSPPEIEAPAPEPEGPGLQRETSGTQTPEPPPDAPEPPKETAPTEKSFYDLDFNALDRGLTPEERQEWNSIYASFRGRSVMTGTVVGVDKHQIKVHDRQTGDEQRRNMYCVLVIPFRVRIYIPEAEMWERRNERPSFVLKNLPGAVIDFVITHVDREGGFAIGSRRLAMNSRRYFFSTQPSLNRPGSRIKCRMLVVGPRRCLVECHGHDIELTQREMRYTAIPDMREEYHPGDELDCVVRAYDRAKNELTISVKDIEPNPFDGAILRHPTGARRQAVIGGKYAGGVFCNLPDGRRCGMCAEKPFAAELQVTKRTCPYNP